MSSKLPFSTCLHSNYICPDWAKAILRYKDELKNVDKVLSELALHGKHTFLDTALAKDLTIEPFSDVEMTMVSSETGAIELKVT